MLNHFESSGHGGHGGPTFRRIKNVEDKPRRGDPTSGHAVTTRHVCTASLRHVRNSRAVAEESIGSSSVTAAPTSSHTLIGHIHIRHIPVSQQ